MINLLVIHPQPVVRCGFNTFPADYDFLDVFHAVDPHPAVLLVIVRRGELQVHVLELQVLVPLLVRLLGKRDDAHATVFLLAPTQFVLVDASRRGRLGGGTFKKLNLSIAASIALIDWMTVYTFGETAKLNPTLEQMATASGGTYNYVGALAVSATILACYLYQGAFAKK